MRVVVHIQGVEELKQRFTKLEQNIPREIVRGINRWGHNVQTHLVHHLQTYPTLPTGKAASSVRWRRMTRTAKMGAISMSKEAYFYDAAKRHKAPVVGKLRQWVRAILPGYQGRYIYVRGHPYIARIYRTRLMRLNAILRDALK